MSFELKRTDTWAGIVFLLFAVGIFLHSGTFPAGSEDTPGAGFFPRVIAVSIGALAIVQIVQNTIREESTVHELTRSEIRKVAIPLALLLLYVGTMPILGFLIGTILFLGVLLRYSGVTSPVDVVLISFGVSVVLQYVFGNFLRIPIPDGLVPVARLLPNLPIVGVLL